MRIEYIAQALTFSLGIVAAWMGLPLPAAILVGCSVYDFYQARRWAKKASRF